MEGDVIDINAKEYQDRLRRSMRLTKLLSIIALAGALSTTLLAGPVTLTDSVANFSGIQNATGWQYGYYTTPFNPTTFSTSTMVFGTLQADKWTLNPCCAPWVVIGADVMHSNSDSHSDAGSNPIPGYDAVQRWTSTYTGQVTISGTVYKEGTGADVVPEIFVNNALVYSLALSGLDLTTHTYSFTQSINSGDTVDLVLGLADPHNDVNASTFFSSTIETATPEPGTVLMFSTGMLAVVLGRIRRRS